jgi:GT2 family glycosyltransferase
MLHEAPTTSSPALTLVICTANRANDLAFALENLTKLRLPPGRSVQFIVVDNGSTDATQAVLTAASQRLPFPLEILYEPQRGLARARNLALKHARGEVIAWTDDDCIVAEDWLERLLGHFDADSSLEVLGGRVELFDPTHFPMTVKTDTVPRTMDLRNCPGDFLLGCNMACRRRVIDRIGGFDSRFGAGAPLHAAEDTDFVYRALRTGSHIAYEPDVVVYHNHQRVTHAQIMQLRRNYNYADGALLMKCLVSGDRMAARWLYWRLRGLSSRVLRPPIWLTSRHDNAVLLLVFLAGAIGYFRHAAWQGNSIPIVDVPNITSDIAAERNS